MAKHLVDLDEEALAAARAELGTTTIKDTVNASLRRAGQPRRAQVQSALSALADLEPVDREQAWR